VGSLKPGLAGGRPERIEFFKGETLEKAPIRHMTKPIIQSRDDSELLKQKQ